MDTSSIPQSPGVYIITCITNAKIYIGSSANLRKRWIDHCNLLVRGKHHNAHLQRAWNKYGEMVFTFVVLEKCEQSILLEREQYWLDTLKPFGKSGFNISIKAGHPTLGRKLSPQHGAKIGEANRRRAVKPETRAKLSIINRGRKQSPEQCIQNSINKKGNKNCVGRIMDAETRAKIGQANLGRKHDSQSVERRVNSLRVNFIAISPTGELFHARGVRRFAREQGLRYTNILGVLSGRNKSHKGWKFKRVED